MSFLSSWFLFALPFVAAPVIVHLYHRRQRVVIPWAAMQFLEEATVTGRASRRIEEWLLLLLRTLMLLAIVLAFAQPLLRGNWFDEGGKSETIIVLDDSMSMSRDVSGSSSLQVMRKRASQLIDRLTDQDQVQVMLASQQQWLTPEGIPANAQTKRRLQQAIDEMAVNQGSADFANCLASIAAVAPHRDAIPRRVVIFTDGQASNWSPRDEVAWKRVRQGVEKSFGSPAVQIVDCSPNDAPIENLAIIKLSTLRTFVMSGGAASCTAEIKNFGATATSSATVDWSVDGRQMADISVPVLQPGESTTSEWEHRFDGFGPHRVDAVVRQPDQLERDNSNSLIIEVVDQIPILVLGRGTSYDPARSDAHFVVTALGHTTDQDSAESQPWQSPFVPTRVTEEQLSELELSDYRAIVIPDLPPLTDDTIERLRSFALAGGGVWLGLGKRVDPKSFNDAWYADGDGLCPLALRPLEGTNDTSKASPSDRIHPPDGNHPVTAILGDTKRLDLDKILIDRRHRFATRTAAQSTDTAAQVTTLLRTGTGDALAVEHFAGRGRVIVQAIPICRDWSNTVLTRSFVVMVHNWLDHLTRTSGTTFNLQPGQPIQVAAPTRDFDGDVTIETPRGEQVRLAETRRGGKPYYRYRGSSTPGAYDVQFTAGNGNQQIVPFFVARSAIESDLRVLADPEWQGFAKLTGIDREAAVVTKTAARQTSTPIAPFLLFVALAALCGEFALSHRIAMQRTTALRPASVASPEPAKTESMPV